MTEATDTNVTWLTQEAFDRLNAELDHLSGPARVEISQRIGAARAEGDIKENGGYHAAKEEQGKMEARIRQLTQLLENAKVGETPKDDGIVEPGMLVTVQMFGDEETFLLGHREIKDATGPEVFSEQSPLGKAINGKKVGESARYDTPSGKSVDVKILKAAPFTG
jgi:transcription elongation factor GreA